MTLAAPPDGAQSIGATGSGQSMAAPQESSHPSGTNTLMENVRKHDLTGYLYTTNRSDHVSARFEPIRGSARVETSDHRCRTVTLAAPPAGLHFLVPTSGTTVGGRPPAGTTSR